MKTKVFLTLCVVFVMGLATSAYAQLVAGSPEDAAYTKIVGEENPDAKTTLLLDFEKQFPQSKVLPDIYVMLMGIYQQKLKNQPPPPNYTPDQWKAYIDNTEQAAKSMLAYARSLATP